MIGFKYGGTHSDTLSVKMVAKRVPLIPPIVENTEAIPGRDGEWDFGVRYGARPIEIDCALLADSAADLKTKGRAFVAHFNPRLGVRSLVFDDDPTVQYFARLTGQLPLDQIVSFGQFTVQLKCPDPFIYSLTDQIKSGTGLIWATHNGTYPASPLLTITTSGGSGALSVESGGSTIGTLTFKSDSPSGTYLIDCKEGTILKGGEGAYHFVSGDFLTLPSGSNKIITTGSVGNVVAEYRDTYL